MYSTPFVLSVSKYERVFVKLSKLNRGSEVGKNSRFEFRNSDLILRLYKTFQITRDVSLLVQYDSQYIYTCGFEIFADLTDDFSFRALGFHN